MTDKIKLPKKFKQELFITLGVGRYNFNKLSVDSYNAVKHGSDGFECILLKTQEVGFDLSDADIKDDAGVKKELVKQLQDQQEKIKAEAHMQTRHIQDKIDNLLAIESHPEPEVAAKRHPAKNTIGG